MLPNFLNFWGEQMASSPLHFVDFTSVGVGQLASSRRSIGQNSGSVTVSSLCVLTVFFLARKDSVGWGR